MNLIWYALWIGSPQREFEAETAIKALGFESFVPVEFKWRLRNPKNPRSKLKVRRAYPLLQRYGFVGFRERPCWRELRDDDGNIRGAGRPILNPAGERVGVVPVIPVRPVGMSPAKPTQLTDDQIGVLASLSSLTLPYAHSSNPHKATLSVRVGDSARIVDGAFFGHCGRVDHIQAEKARVILNFLGSMRPVEVSLSALEAA